MPQGLNEEQKGGLRLLFKIGHKILKRESQIRFLNKCLENEVIVKCFKITHQFPGPKSLVEKRKKEFSFGLMKDELHKHKSELGQLHLTLSKAKINLKNVFTEIKVLEEISKFESHCKKQPQPNSREAIQLSKYTQNNQPLPKFY